MHAASAWSHILNYDIMALESILWRFTKVSPGHELLSYEQRLRSLNVKSLGNAKKMADLVHVYKCIHHINGLSLNNAGFRISLNNERSGMPCLQQPGYCNNTALTLFKFRAPRLWNDLCLFKYICLIKKICRKRTN